MPNEREINGVGEKTAQRVFLASWIGSNLRAQLLKGLTEE